MPKREKFISHQKLSARRDVWHETETEPASAEDLAYTIEPMSCEMTWAGFCTRHAIAAPQSAARFRVAEKMFRSICRPERVADVTPEMLTLFVDALRARGMKVAEVRLRVVSLWAGISWGIAGGVIDGRRFPVQLTLNSAWQWTPVGIRVRGAAAA